MPSAEQTETARLPLTVLTEDEKLFQTSVRQFARERIRPCVREMDEAGVFRQDLIRQFFEMGLMGIEIPEEHGGQGGSFFQAILAIEELSAVDPSAGVVVDVQNTICNNALLHWATAEQKARYLPRLAADTVGAYALSEAGSGSDAFAMAARAQDCGDHFVLNGDVLLLCSDGLHGAIPAAGIEDIVNGHSDLNAAARELIDAANERDGGDNVSVQLIRVKSVERVGMYRGRPYKLA